MILRNTGVSSETIALEITGPTGWNARFETTSYPTLQISAVHLLADAEKPTTVRFKAKPPSGAKSGTYTFTLTARTEDGKLSQSLNVRVVLQPTTATAETEKETKLVLSVNYPSLENPAGKDFTYDITIRNQADTERVVNLRAQVPFLWRAYFTPAGRRTPASPPSRSRPTPRRRCGSWSPRPWGWRRANTPSCSWLRPTAMWPPWSSKRW